MQLGRNDAVLADITMPPPMIVSASKPVDFIDWRPESGALLEVISWTSQHSFIRPRETCMRQMRSSPRRYADSLGRLLRGAERLVED